MVIIKKDKEFLVTNRNPWLYSGAIQTVKGKPENGDIVPVCSIDGRILGYGYYSTDSLISVRIISFQAEKPADNWLQERIREAFHLRRELNIPSNGYRLINAEGDFIPGLVIDVYNKTTVIRPLIKGIENNLSRIIDTLDELLPGNSVYIKRDEYTARREKITVSNGYIKGSGDGIDTIDENGLSFIIDIREGQKTGFYLDLRDARILCSAFSKGKRVLNLFSYTGAFAFHAAKGGAAAIVSVEQSKQAIEYAQKNMHNNQGLVSSFDWKQADVFDYLPGAGKHDLVILDPPPFARKKSEVAGAVKGYTFLNTQALLHLDANGFLFTFSCSHAVGKDIFLASLHDAALKSGRNVRIIRELHSSPDHPFSIVHPEGEYVKGWILHVQ